MRTILRAFLIVFLVAVAGFLALGYWSGSRFNPNRTVMPSESVGTSGSIDKAREAGAEIGEKAAVAAQKVGETVSEAALTTKIKAKMALDDTIKARAIDVTTNDAVVTLSGTVGTTAERERAISLARETAGVSRVIDHLQVR